MVGSLKQWVINIVTLALFIVMFEMLLPTGKMKKMVSLVTGTILIIAIITPLFGLFGKNIDITALQASNSNMLDKLQIEKDRTLLEGEQMDQIVAVYRRKIIEQLEQNAEEVEGVREATADVIFNEDYNSQTFGELRRVYLYIALDAEKESSGISGAEKAVGESDGSVAAGENAGTAVDRSDGDGETSGSSQEGTADSTRKESAEVKTVQKVERVKVGDVKKTQELDETMDPAVKKKLEERISGVFNINSSDIVISKAKR